MAIDIAAEADHAEAVRLMTAAYILTGLRIKKGSLANIYKGIGMLQESAAYDEIMEEGEIKNNHEILLLLGKKKFGEADKSIVAELTAIRDLDRLKRLAGAIFTAESWRELLDTPLMLIDGVSMNEEKAAFDEILEEGELRGEIKRSHRILLRQGRKCFGTPDEAIEAEMTAIKDLDRLERLTDAIFTAKSWRELLDTA